jgi:hypothetical protein
MRRHLLVTGDYRRPARTSGLALLVLRGGARGISPSPGWGWCSRSALMARFSARAPDRSLCARHEPEPRQELVSRPAFMARFSAVLRTGACARGMSLSLGRSWCRGESPSPGWGWCSRPG